MVLNLSYSNITAEIPPWQAFVDLQLNDQLLYLINPFLVCTTLLISVILLEQHQVTRRKHLLVSTCHCVESHCKPCNPQAEKKLKDNFSDK